MNTHNSWPLCSGESYPESDLKRPVLTLEKTKCLSVCYRSKNQLSPEPAAHLLLGQHHCSGTSGKDSFPPRFCLRHPADERHEPGAPEARSPPSPAPYCHVSRFPARASNGRSRFPSLRLPRSILPQVEDGPLGRLEVQAVASDCCLVEHLFKINFILPSKCDLWNAMQPPDPRREGSKLAERSPG